MSLRAYSVNDPRLFAESRSLGQKAAQMLDQPTATQCSNDLADASARLANVYTSNRLQLVRGGGAYRSFHMRLRTATVGRLQLATLAFGTEVDLEQLADRPIIVVTTQVGGFSRVKTAHASAEGGSGFVVVDSSFQRVNKRFSADSERCNVRIEQAVLDQKCAALLGHPLEKPLCFSPFTANNSIVRNRWMGLLQMLLGYVDAAVGLDTAAYGRADGVSQRGFQATSGIHGRLKPIIGHLEEAVLLHLLLEHEHCYSAALRQVPGKLAPRHVRRAEEYMRSHAAQMLSLEQISSAVGCSVRTLSEGFRKARGLSPMAFLRQIRLEGAHADLSQGNTPGGVSEIALRWGFLHLGRFAVNYRRHFGQSPSVTLRQGSQDYF